MNFFTDKTGSGINSIGVYIHATHIVLIVDGVNKVYIHSKWEEAIDFLRNSFKENKIEFIEKYIIDNLDHIGAKYKIKKIKPKENDQLSLF